MIEVTQEVLKAGREAAALGDGWELQLALDVDGSVHVAQEAFGHVVTQVERQAEDADADPASVGEWESAVLGRSLIIRVSASEDFERALGRVRDHLQGAGVHGRIRVWQAARSFIPPDIAPMLCCKLRVRGERTNRGEGMYRWTADGAAFRDALVVAEGWSRARSRRTGPSSVSTTATGWVSPDDLAGDLIEVMVREVGEFKSAASATIDRSGFRAIEVHPRGGISLVVAGRRLKTGWAQEVDQLSELLRKVASDVTLASVRRGWKARRALDDLYRPDDWPVRPGYRPQGNTATVVAFEDLFAPDAYGLQLLGSGYTGRLALGGEAAGRWHTEAVGDATLLTHAEPERWFAAPPTRLVGPTTVEVEPDAAAVLEEARADLSEILYRPGVLAAHGFGDMADR